MPEKARDLLWISFVHHKGKYNWKIQFCKILPNISSHPLYIHILWKGIGGIFQFQCHIILPRCIVDDVLWIFFLCNISYISYFNDLYCLYYCVIRWIIVTFQSLLALPLWIIWMCLFKFCPWENDLPQDSQL